MTSNSPDSLDAALLRPGRIDSKVLFGYANREVSEQIFLHIFTKTADEILSKNNEEEDEGYDSSSSTTSHPSPSDLLTMSKQFAACIPETKVSPAEIQGFLMRHRDDPAAAVANADVWAKEVLAVKKQGKNVAAFDNEIKRGGALFAGKGTQLAPNGVNGTHSTAYNPLPVLPVWEQRQISNYIQAARASDVMQGIRPGSALSPGESKGLDDDEFGDLVGLDGFQPSENVDGVGNGDVLHGEQEARQKAAHPAFTLQAAHA